MIPAPCPAHSFTRGQRVKTADGDFATILSTEGTMILIQFEEFNRRGGAARWSAWFHCAGLSTVPAGV